MLQLLSPCPRRRRSRHCTTRTATRLRRSVSGAIPAPRLCRRSASTPHRRTCLGGKRRDLTGTSHMFTHATCTCMHVHCAWSSFHARSPLRVAQRACARYPLLPWNRAATGCQWRGGRHARAVAALLTTCSPCSLVAGGPLAPPRKRPEQAEHNVLAPLGPGPCAHHQAQAKRGQHARQAARPPS